MTEPYYSDDHCTIYHGNVLTVLAELERLDALVTDPPYSSGGAYRGDRMMGTVAKYVNSEQAHYHAEFAGDNRDQRSYLAWCSLWMAVALDIATPGAACAIFTDWRQLPTTTDAIQSGGWVWRGLGVWDKTEGCRPRVGGLASQSEFVVWGTAGPMVAGANPVALPGVLRTPSPRGETKRHTAEKPETVMTWLAQLAPAGGVVVDPFMGSGSTLVAAKATGRRAVGIGLDEHYCEVAARRLDQGVLDFGPAA